MAKFKRDILVDIIASLDEPAYLSDLREKFEENRDLTITEDYIRKVVSDLEREGKVETEKEVKKSYLKLKVIPIG